MKKRTYYSPRKIKNISWTVFPIVPCRLPIIDVILHLQKDIPLCVVVVVPSRAIVCRSSHSSRPISRGAIACCGYLS